MDGDEGVVGSGNDPPKILEKGEMGDAGAPSVEKLRKNPAGVPQPDDGDDTGTADKSSADDTLASIGGRFFPIFESADARGNIIDRPKTLPRLADTRGIFFNTPWPII